MIKSMTGFGRYELLDSEHKLTIEMKSVNHRYFDVSIRMPKRFSMFEAAIRNLLKKYVQRGKVDICITYEDYTENQYSLKYNAKLAEEYLKYLNKMADQFQLENDIKVSALSRYPEVLTMEEQKIDEKELWKFLENAVCEAAKQLSETREKEGSHLKADMLQKLDVMSEHVEYIIVRSPQIIDEYKKRLEEKVKEVLTDSRMEESRILTEVTLYADKTCLDEELVRLKSHIQATRSALEEEDGVGRKLDFIAQEMNREANTILSKTTDLDISNRAIALKTEIEKVREQIQNIE